MPKRNEKYHRMAVRRDIGNRRSNNLQPQPQPTNRYFVAHACFTCRKSYKLDPERDHICPKCGKAMHWMGRAFKTPRRLNVEQWAKVEALFNEGFRFHHYGGDYPPLPKRRREVEEFVRRHPDHPLRVGRVS